MAAFLFEGWPIHKLEEMNVVIVHTIMYKAAMCLIAFAKVCLHLSHEHFCIFHWVLVVFLDGIWDVSFICSKLS